MFIWNSRHTVRFPISRIEEIHPDCGPEGDKERYSKIFLQGDDEAIVRTADIDAIGRAIVSVIPAPAGYSIIHPALNDQDRGYVVVSSPVIGFAVSSDGETRPLTARGIDDGMFRLMPVQHPNGFVWDEANDCGYDELREYLKEWAAAEQARRATDAEQSNRAAAQ